MVDDYPSLRLTMAALIERHGMTCELFESAPTALESLRESPAAVVITDYRMPGMTGIELIQAIRRAWVTRTILVTGYETPAVITEAIELGARVILKPFGQYDFIMAVHGALAEYEVALERQKKLGRV